MLNESTSFQLAFAGIGAAEDNNNSLYNNLTGANTMADINLEHGDGGSLKSAGGTRGCMVACRKGSS